MSRVYGKKNTFPCSSTERCGKGKQPFSYQKDCCPTEIPTGQVLAETEWVEFPFVIQDTSGPGGSLVPLAFPTPADSNEGATAKYYIQGSVMHLQYNYRFTGAAAAGTGTYIVNLPTGFTYNSQLFEIIGSMGGNASGTLFTGCVTSDFGFPEKKIVCFLNDATTTELWGSGSIAALDVGNLVFSFNGTIEIVRD